MKRLAILGASGHGKVAADIAETRGWSEIVFFDDAWPSIEKNGHWPICGDTDMLTASLKSFDGVFVAIGDNSTRETKFQSLIDLGARLISLIHPSSTVSRYAVLAEGTIVMPNVVINADASLGRGCIINTGATVDHDCFIASYVHLSPGVNLSGEVSVDKRSWIGTGACVRQQIRIGSDVIVGAGAVVVSNLDNDVTVVGNPARILNRE